MAPDKFRPGVEKAIDLYNTSCSEQWIESLNSYEECLSTIQENLKPSQLKLSKLAFLDDEKWKDTDLRKKLNTDKCLNLKDLERLMIWKLRRGQFRPTLMNLIRRNSSEFVKQTTSEAIGHISKTKSDVDESMKILCSLQGVGPATASLILSVICPENVAFMSDEAMDAALGLPRSYTIQTFRKFQSALVSKAAELGDDWNPDLVEKALFSAAVMAR